MNPFLLVLAAIVFVVVAAFAYVAVRRLMARQPRIVWHENATGAQQWTVSTPAGPAVVTAVRDERGNAFEIETNFRRQGVRLHYVAPARKVAERRLVELVEEYHAERAA